VDVAAAARAVPSPAPGLKTGEAEGRLGRVGPPPVGGR
jgi:hypothetical protein